MSPNRYEVLGKIADGGLGSVYKAYDRNLRREVALKRVRAESPEQAEQQAEQLLNEARTLSSLQHPHIVTIYDVGRDEEGAYLIMELLKGETLENIIERGALSEVDFWELASQSLEGMIAAHATGLIHLDIKPQNFMVVWLASGKFQIKILDFGLSKIAHQATVQDMDEDGAIMGSIFFMAPEQFERVPVDVRTDLYSLGCVFYYALTQHYPFQGETGHQVMASHLYHSLLPLSELRPDLPAFIPQWLEWLMARSPENRPPDAATAYQYFKLGSFDAGATPVVEQVAEEEVSQHPGDTGSGQLRSGTGPLRPTVKRPTRPVPTVRAPGGASQPIGQRPGAPRPIIKPINIATAMAPRHLQSRRKPVPKIISVGLPILVVLIAAAFLYLQKRAEDLRTARLEGIYTQEHPAGNSADVDNLFKMLEDPAKSAMAGIVLGKLQGVDSEDDALARQVPKARSAWAQKNLVDAIGQRAVRDATPALIDLLGASKAPEVRSAIWKALATCGQVSDLPDMLSKMADTTEHDEFIAAEKAVTAVALRDVNADHRSSPIVKAYKANSGSDDFQATLLHIMGRVHGATSLVELQKALRSTNQKLRIAAAAACGEWPNGDPLRDLLAALGTEKIASIKAALIISIGKLAGESSEISQEEIGQTLINVYATAGSAEAKEILNTMTYLADPVTDNFLKELSAKQKDPVDRITTARLEKIVAAALENAIPLGDAVTLDAGKAQISQGLLQRDGVISNWRRLTDRVSWLVQVQQPGRYEAQLAQASVSRAPGRYVLGIGREQFEHQVLATSKANDFKNVILGRVRFTKPGMYRVVILPIEIAPEDQLMYLKQVELKKVEN